MTITVAEWIVRIGCVYAAAGLPFAIPSLWRGAADGTMVNDQVLNMVAEPSEVTGRVRRVDDLLVLYSDPATYERLE